MLYIVTAQSAHWAAPDDYCVVEAKSLSEAELKAEEHFESYYQELYSSEYEDESYEDEARCVIIHIEEFGPSHDMWKYYTDPEQAEFFPLIT